MTLEAGDLDFMFGGVTAPDASAMLWGCNLGENEQSSLARVLADRGYFHKVTGADSATDFEQIIRQRKPGDELSIDFERRGRRVSAKLRLAADPQLEIVPAQSVSAEQRRLRDAWLSSAARNVF